MAFLPQDAANALCEKCSVFNISEEAFYTAALQEHRVKQLGLYDEVLARTNCPLCHVIASAFRDGPVDQDNLHGCHIHGNWNRIIDGLGNACLSIWLTDRGGAASVELTVRIVEHGRSPSVGSGRMVNSPRVDFDLVKTWIGLCETSHDCKNVPLAATRAGRLPEGFMVIDVVENCLVKPDPSCRFFALSYVWGITAPFRTTTQNVDSLRMTGAIDRVRDELSPSVRDAIELVRKIGERFLWVDALCIQQDNSANLAANVEAMDSIYRHAALVIIIADDEVLAEGIPGMSARPRHVNQYVFEVIPNLRVLARFNCFTYMRHARYRTRGWT